MPSSVNAANALLMVRMLRGGISGFFSILSAYAQITAATTRVTILAYTMPIWAVLLAWMVLRERPNASQTLAVVLCALGLANASYTDSR
jgi:drug/metabolite transporter (DMT)-like permease